MRKQWVAEISEFFESLGKQNSRFSIRRKRNIDDRGMEHRESESSERRVSQADRDSHRPSTSSQDSEHCCTVDKARRIFEAASQTSPNGPISPASPSGVNKLKQSPRMVSSFDIFSGADVDHDFPPIDDDIEEDGVYPCADVHPRTNRLPNSDSNDGVDKRKKAVMKSNSYSNKKSNFRKSHTGRPVPDDREAEKENEGVIIRMRNQESYYDGKDKYQSQLPELPLYQVYENSRLRRSHFAQKSAHIKSVDLSDYDAPSDIFQTSIIFPDVSLPAVDSNCKAHDRMPSHEEENDSLELEPECDSYADNRALQFFSEDAQRLKWAETEEGKKLIKMQKLSDTIIKWQEAQFEVITSEASYYRSLEILVNKIYKSSYMNCYKEKTREPNSDSNGGESDEPGSPVIKAVINATQKHHLFSNILEIHIVSGELLKALESRWRENPFIKDLSDILVDFSKEKLKPYVTYLRNQRFQTDTYNQLLNQPEFLNVIKIFEKDPDCMMMNLCSFLMLPMQRVLRLKLLMSVVKNHIPPDYPTTGCDDAIASLDKLIKECSDEKMLMEQKEEIMLICNRLIMKDKMRASIGNKPLLKNGQLKVIASNNIASKCLGSSLMGRNNNKATLYLFEDQLIITKPRKLPLCVSGNDDREVVVDICKRSDVKFFSGLTLPQPLIKTAKTASSTDFKITLSPGVKGVAEYTCSAETQDEWNEWRNVFSVNNSMQNNFEFSEAYVKCDYTPKMRNEMPLKKGQIVNIVKHLDNSRAIASLGHTHGEINLEFVQFISSPQPNNPHTNKDFRLNDPDRHAE